MKKLAGAVRSFRVTLIMIAVFSLFGAMLQLTIPLYMLQIYDRVLPSKSTDTLVFLSIIAAFALVVLGLTEMVRQILGTRASAKLDTMLCDEVMERVIQEGHRTNGSAQPLRDLQSVRSLLSSKVLFGLVDLPFSSVFIACLYFVHPNLFWLSIVGAVTLAALAVINLKLTAKASAAQAKAVQTAHQQSDFFARNADSIIAMGMVRDVVAGWTRWNADALIAADTASGRNSFFGGLSRTIRFGIQAAMLGFGAYLVQTGEMTAGMIFAASIISGRALQPIDMVINSWPQLSAGRQSWNNLVEFMKTSETRKQFTQVEAPEGHLTAHNIFQPNPLDAGKPAILSRVSFELEAGKSVAVIGPSGSGKSTLAKIIAGARKPRSGEVRLDGHTLANWEPQDLGRHIGYLAQDVELLPGTIAQNIARFRNDATDEDIRTAAAMAHVEDLIKKMPQGYDTLIGPGGLNVSGGEKQRIALARAFFGKPRLVVLDEPNSSLDRFGENALMRALEVARENGMTVFLVTQREGVVNAVDNIMRIRDGRIIDYGGREAVIRKTTERLHEIRRKMNEKSGIKAAVVKPDREAG